MKIRFLGAAQQVTGSCYLLEAGGLRLLIDCGLFQERAYVARNWAKFPVDPSSIDFLLLTHAHLDHTGLIPKLVHEGFKSPILTTPASIQLAGLILEDAGDIQEEDAAYKRKRHKREGRTGAHPAVPLYTSKDVASALPLFKKVRYQKPFVLNDAVTVTFHDAGHILGSAMLEIVVQENGQSRTVVFSGDIGQRDKPIIRDPSLLDHADYIIMESTYGARNHSANGSIEDHLCEIINTTAKAGGNVVIPTFAVERAQELLYYVGELVRQERVPEIKIFLDSPMAVDVTEVFRQHRECMDEEALELLNSGQRLFKFPGLRLVRSAKESKTINHMKETCIILATSGMCTAGRIKHHLAHNLPRKESTIVFVGYQARGTLGREILKKKSHVRIHGADRQIKARIDQLQGLSAHADQQGLLDWLGHFKSAPKGIFLTHGEADAAEALAKEIKTRWNYKVEVPAYQDERELA